ncbi:GNAT family N-acetyltransferase [Vibrio parahaemolyticus]|uniref:GNAT family N-acetyltransferase n=1 Tax=Vibrio harveyi group TaxID=717610 RepID=UPI0007A028F5|nr:MULTISPECIES: GNAT family N-acetyltransferase [Vibrio harveyi group]AOV89703.1 Acetyltransferase family protein [Vibrio parahaemolyticus]EIW7860253.1 GNAT family N-acetyltransferase [Vibrio parahaemolyticus]EJG0412319.1 GNAT family N-acetyltransferase [Vibrio parahaemolyticus]ELA7254713.1 GNAT family N-acetyltransferase [Vibrio parahaemolyticus]ELB2051458.1 GNAT family N-acetyltransferase [Vibrio parahaemolyticus]
MEIREAQASDIDSLLRLNYQIGIMHFENAPEAFVEPSFEEKEFLLNALNDQSRLFLVAEVSGAVVGFITATVSQNEVVPFLVKTPICRVGTIVVDESARTSGIGTQLMAKCSDWAKSQGAEQIKLEVMAFNSHAQKFYTKLGFAEQSKTLWKTVS